MSVKEINSFFIDSSFLADFKSLTFAIAPNIGITCQSNFGSSGTAIPSLSSLAMSKIQSFVIFNVSPVSPVSLCLSNNFRILSISGSNAWNLVEGRNELMKDQFTEIVMVAKTADSVIYSASPIVNIPAMTSRFQYLMVDHSQTNTGERSRRTLRALSQCRIQTCYTPHLSMSKG